MCHLWAFTVTMSMCVCVCAGEFVLSAELYTDFLCSLLWWICRHTELLLTQGTCCQKNNWLNFNGYNIYILQTLLCTYLSPYWLTQARFVACDRAWNLFYKIWVLVLCECLIIHSLVSPKPPTHICTHTHTQWNSLRDNVLFMNKAHSQKHTFLSPLSYTCTVCMSSQSRAEGLK